MPNCSFIKRRHRKVCTGDLTDRIILHDREIRGIQLDEDFTEDFKNDLEVWALVETVKGIVVFDKTNTQIAPSHTMVVRFDSSITAETWIEFKEKKFDIVDTENLEERDEWLILFCRERGIKTKPVNLS